MPTIQIPKKLQPLLTAKQRINVVIGGRSSGKSETIGRLMTMKCQVEQADILCGREFQNSIDDSVHKLIKSVVNKLGIDGAFNITDKKIDCLTGGCFRFRGFSRNPEAVKSAQDFKYSWIEEAQNLTQDSIDDLLPTIRSSGSQLYFTANPGSSADPFSKRFILPFKRQIDTDGFYADDMHLIIKVNWRDNPWHGELEAQRVWDYENLPRAKYDHIWEGEFNDSIEDALVQAEWFDACIDAHKTLGFHPIGARIAAHDPSDTGPDSKGYAMRHGSIILDIQEKIDGDINEGCDWATGIAISQGVDHFTWDCDGMGVGINRQISEAFRGKRTILTQFKGSEGVDNPDSIFDHTDDSLIRDQKRVKDAVKNKRSQYYYELRKRIHNTYMATKGIYCDPDKMISFDSRIKLLSKLRSELCRMPIKPNNNGLFELYTKQDLKSKFKFASPNLADSVMMTTRMVKPSVVNRVVIPQPVRVMGMR